MWWWIIGIILFICICIFIAKCIRYGNPSD